MLQFKEFEVKAEGKTVGKVQVPVFDEKDFNKGLKEISEYDWKSAGYEGGYQQAIVQLVNTQHGTNLRNELRQKNSGKVTGAWIEAQAMSRITMEEFQASVGDPNKLAAVKDKYVQIIKKEIEDKKKAATEAAGTTAEEAADAGDAADTQEVTGGVTA